MNLQFCLCLQSLSDREEFAASVLASQDSEIAQYPLMSVSYIIQAASLSLSLAKVRGRSPPSCANDK